MDGNAETQKKDNQNSTNFKKPAQVKTSTLDKRKHFKANTSPMAEARSCELIKITRS